MGTVQIQIEFNRYLKSCITFCSESKSNAINKLFHIKFKILSFSLNLKDENI